MCAIKHFYMAQLYTATQKNTITSFRYRVWINAQEIAPIPAEDLTFSYTPNVEMINSAMGGETAIAAIEKGTNPVVSFTVNGLNKANILNAFSGTMTSGSTATNVSTPFVGTLKGVATPKRLTEVNFVAVLYFTNDSGQTYLADATVTTLPLNILMPKAVTTGGGEFVFNPTAPGTYTLELTGIGDVVNDNQTFIIDDGIDTDGTYTP